MVCAWCSNEIGFLPLVKNAASLFSGVYDTAFLLDGGHCRCKKVSYCSEEHRFLHQPIHELYCDQKDTIDKRLKVFINGWFDLLWFFFLFFISFFFSWLTLFCFDRDNWSADFDQQSIVWPGWVHLFWSTCLSYFYWYFYLATTPFGFRCSEHVARRCSFDREGLLLFCLFFDFFINKSINCL